jgi:hypothetical protein
MTEPRVSTESAWRTSSYSGGQGGNCVQVAAGSRDEVAVRDSKDTPGPVLSFPHEAWLGFVAGLKG